MEVISHWHPNITINIVDDHTPWVKGSVPPPLDQCEPLPWAPHPPFPCLRPLSPPSPPRDLTGSPPLPGSLPWPAPPQTFPFLSSSPCHTHW